VQTRPLILSALAAALLLAAGPALTQTSQPMSDPASPQGPSIGTQATVDEEDDNDWGWIGVVGLAGLAGLFRRRDRDTGATRTTH